MELPKNITQIGEINPNCKIYIEDYVISFLKQLNKNALDKTTAAALYGDVKKEGDVSYIFIYGACKLESLQRESRHLSQAQLQEIENFRKKYFPDYELIGYKILDGEMIEGCHVCEQGICRYVEGLCQFYEKNESMLAYMLDVRDDEASSEVVNSEKYDMVKKRQEERKAQFDGGTAEEQSRVVRNTSENVSGTVSGQNPVNSGTQLRRMKFAAAAVFALLCIAGTYTMRDSVDFEGIKNAAGDIVEDMTAQRLPDSMPVSNTNVQNGHDMDSTLIAEDKLTEALQYENQGSMPEATPIPTEISSEMENTPTEQPLQPAETQAEPTEQPVVQDDVKQTYIIKKGDTLRAISVRNYGDSGKVEEICNLNNIDNPDDIKVGQKILLP